MPLHQLQLWVILSLFMSSYLLPVIQRERERWVAMRVVVCCVVADSWDVAASWVQMSHCIQSQGLLFTLAVDLSCSLCQFYYCCVPDSGDGVLWWECVCLCVWLSVGEPISGTTRLIFTKFFCIYLWLSPPLVVLQYLVLWMTSYVHIIGLMEACQYCCCLTLLCCIQANALAASYRLHHVLDNGGFLQLGESIVPHRCNEH